MGSLWGPYGAAMGSLWGRGPISASLRRCDTSGRATEERPLAVEVRIAAGRSQRPSGDPKRPPKNPPKTPPKNPKRPQKALKGPKRPQKALKGPVSPQLWRQGKGDFFLGCLLMAELSTPFVCLGKVLIMVRSAP